MYASWQQVGGTAALPVLLHSKCPSVQLPASTEGCSLQADKDLAAMSRLPRTLSQFHTSKSAIQSATNQPLPGTRLLHSLQTTFPADGLALTGTGTRAALSHSRVAAAASNPRIAPYAALPSESALSLVPHLDKALNIPGIPGQQVTSPAHDDHRQLVKRRRRQAPVSGLHSQQAQTKRYARVKAHRPGRLPKRLSKQNKLSTIDSNSTQRPQSAGLRTAGQYRQPAVADRAVKQKPRACSVSPNSQYHFSCTSSVPEDAAAWIAATTDAGSRYVRSYFELQQEPMPVECQLSLYCPDQRHCLAVACCSACDGLHMHWPLLPMSCRLLVHIGPCLGPALFACRRVKN